MATMQRLPALLKIMDFIIRQPALSALILLVISSIIVIVLDIKRNSLTLPRLVGILRRDKLTTAIMIMVAYSICFLCVNGLIAAIHLFYIPFTSA